MPYTQEELKNLSFYQKLIDEDEQQYLTRKALLLQQSAASGSADDGFLLTRDESGAVLIFEDPYANKLNEDPSTKIIYNTIIKLLKTTSADTIIDEVLDRDFREL